MCRSLKKVQNHCINPFIPLSVIPLISSMEFRPVIYDRWPLLTGARCYRNCLIQLYLVILFEYCFCFKIENETYDYIVRQAKGVGVTSGWGATRSVIQTGKIKIKENKISFFKLVNFQKRNLCCNLKEKRLKVLLLRVFQNLALP